MSLLPGTAGVFMMGEIYGASGRVREGLAGIFFLARFTSQKQTDVFAENKVGEEKPPNEKNK